MSFYSEQSDAVRDLCRYGLELMLRLYNRNEGLDRMTLFQTANAASRIAKKRSAVMSSRSR